jgi:hypothetical protein
MTDRTRPLRVLLQTTIPFSEDDWSIARFGRLATLLANDRNIDGSPSFEVVARDRDPVGRPDSVLCQLDHSKYDELWLFAMDRGDGLTQEDGAAIDRFWRNGHGLLVARDHMDLGCSICQLAGMGDGFTRITSIQTRPVE